MEHEIQKFTLRQQMFSHSYEIYRYRDAYLNEVALHHHDFYEVYLFVSGKVVYTVESYNYQLLPGDLLLINPLELHQPRITQEKTPYERIVLWVNKSFMEQIGTPKTSLTRCFDNSVSGHTNLLRLSPVARAQITDLMEYLISETSSEEYGADISAVACLLQLLVKINRQVETMKPVHEITDKSAPIVKNVLRYINDHYEEDLSLDMLAAQFFVSKYHLSHEFNRLVGTSIYRYIIQKRLVIAKQMLGDGLAPMAVYQHCGFGDYSNFYRAFKNEYGISPKKFTEIAQNAAP